MYQCVCVFVPVILCQCVCLSVAVSVDHSLSVSPITLHVCLVTDQHLSFSLPISAICGSGPNCWSRRPGLALSLSRSHWNHSVYIVYSLCKQRLEQECEARGEPCPEITGKPQSRVRGRQQGFMGAQLGVGGPDRESC